jgi:hypothetical protein
MKIFTSYLETHPGSLADCEAIVKKFWRNIVFSLGREELIAFQIVVAKVLMSYIDVDILASIRKIGKEDLNKMLLFSFKI